MLQVRICGVDIKASQAIITVCDPSPGAAIPLNIGTTKLTLKADDGADLKSFMRAVQGIINDNSIDCIIIKERLSKGPRSASGVTFKIEALFQLCHDDTRFVHSKTLEKFKKDNKAGIPANLPKIQHDSFLASAWLLNEKELL